MWADEYQNLLVDFTSAVEDELLQYVRGLILFGSYHREQQESGWIIPGTSDLDLVLILDLDDPNPDKPPRRLAKIGEVLSVFFTHPVYAPLLDLTILEYHDLPVYAGMSFSPIHAVSAANNGRVLLGKNVLQDVAYSEKLLNRCAKVIIYQNFENIRVGYLHRSIIGENQLSYDFADMVLDIAHASLAFSGIFNLVRPEVPEKFDLLLGDKIDSDIGVDIVYEAKKVRMGSQKMNRQEFLSGTLQFAQSVVRFIRNPFN
ncbi:MAG: hypothetical protein ACTSPV_12085 [Candidatus Hodarchaeales archaeon]